MDDPAIGFDVVAECDNVAVNIADGADDAPELVGGTPIGIWAPPDGVDRCVELLMVSPTRADGGGIVPKPIVITEPYLEDTKWKTKPAFSHSQQYFGVVPGQVHL